MSKGKKKRVSKYLSRSRWIFYMPLIGLTVIGLLLLMPDIYLLIYKEPLRIPPLSDLTYGDKINIMLTFAIAMFAAVEGYSTYTQVVLEDRRNKMESAKGELEKAYAPLYTLLNRFQFGASEDKVVLEERDKTRLDQIMAAYPFMFPAEIYEIWHQKIYKMKPTEIDLRNIDSFYEISKEFVEKLASEYDRRVKRYNEIFGESPDDNKKG
jgi:hypothetical protein